MAERMVHANGVELCTEAFGDPTDPTILLITGIGASMLWWDEEFCDMVAGRGRHVIRYDHRDTGRSVTYAPADPAYTGGDLVADAAGVIDACSITPAHVVGVSAGGAFAQLLAVDFADRVRTLVLISTSPALPVDRRLPAPTDEFRQSRPRPRWTGPMPIRWPSTSSRTARLLAGGHRPFDEEATLRLIRRDMDHAIDFAAVRNRDAIPDDGRQRHPLSSIAVPTLVIHGTADPMFPVAHGEALAEIIPNARLLMLGGAGHGIDRADWDTIANTIIEHTHPD